MYPHQKVRGRGLITKRWEHIEGGGGLPLGRVCNTLLLLVLLLVLLLLPLLLLPLLLLLLLPLSSIFSLFLSFSL